MVMLGVFVRCAGLVGLNSSYFLHEYAEVEDHTLEQAGNVWHYMNIHLDIWRAGDNPYLAAKPLHLRDRGVSYKTTPHPPHPKTFRT